MACLNIRQPVELLRGCAHRLGEHDPGLRGDGRLARARAHGRARDFDEVAEVEECQLVEGIPDHVLSEERLDAAAAVANIGEGRLPHIAEGNEAAGNGDGCAFVGVLLAFGQLRCLRGRVGAGAAGGIRVDARQAGSLKLPQSLFPQLIHRPLPSFYRALPHRGAVNRCSST